MTTPLPQTPAPPPRASHHAAFIITGAIAIVLALGFLAAAGALLWADGQRDDQGYIASGSHGVATSSSALRTDNLDLDLDGAEKVFSPDQYGRLRLKVDPRGDKPVF